jgi:hypothetical protein
MAILSRIRVALALLLLVASGQAATPASEYQVKAVFLYNFSRFVAWPDAVFASADSPFVVGVFGHDPFGRELDEVVRGETVHGHPLVVRRVTDAESASGCHILFIHQSEDEKLDSLIEALDKHATLTVSDIPGAAQRGVIIRLVTDQGRVRMIINMDSAREAQLTISSNLLRSAQIIGPATGAP